MKRITIGLIAVATAGAFGWWSSRHRRAAQDGLTRRAAEPSASAGQPEIDPNMIKRPPNVDPNMIKRPPNVDPNMVKHPSIAPRDGNSRAVPTNGEQM